MKTKKKALIAITAVAVVFAILFAVCAVYVNDYYRADSEAIAAFAVSEQIDTSSYDGMIVYSSSDCDTGLIFYPGGKVEYTAYEPLMKALASKGIMCVLVEMPFNLAVLNINAADGIIQQYPAITQWYIGGHSLGGSMAASYAAEHEADFKGIVLLGAYSTADISSSQLDVISVYGSEDKVLNKEKYDECKANLPADFTQIVIENGCHAYFGMYGMQEGDGTPKISNEEQINFTADVIAENIKK